MNNDIDIEHLAKILDSALASDNPSVKRALRNFLLVASLTESEKTDEVSDKSWGFHSVIQEIKALRRRVETLEYTISYNKHNNASITTSSTSIKDYYYENIMIPDYYYNIGKKNEYK